MFLGRTERIGGRDVEVCVEGEERWVSGGGVGDLRRAREVNRTEAERGEQKRRE